MKLKEKCANELGSYILRESETEYCVYYIDVYNKAGTISSQEIVEAKPEFVMTNSSRVHESLRHLISSFQKPNENPMKIDILWKMFGIFGIWYI